MSKNIRYLIETFKNIDKLISEQAHTITEHLHDLDNDVDLIYDKYYKEDLEKLQTTRVLTDDMFSRHVTDTSILGDEKSVESHAINPCKIFINHSSNFYNFSELIISIGVSPAAIDYVKLFKDVNKGGYDLDLAISEINKNFLDEFISEFTEHKIKGSINHELLHWINDSLDNNTLKKVGKRIAKVGRTKYFKGKDINSRNIEIQAQLGNVKQIKRKYSEEWDSMTFGQLLKLSSPLKKIFNDLPYNERREWVKNLVKRMHREGLMGKAMRWYNVD